MRDRRFSLCRPPDRDWETTEDLRRIQNEAETTRPTANPAPGSTADQRAAIRSQVLPQVEAALGERGTYQAVNAILRDQDAEQNRIALQQRLDRQALSRPPRFADDREWLSSQIEDLDADYRQPMSPRLLDNLVTTREGVTQSTLPGLWEQVEIARQDTIERQSADALQRVYQLLGEYPEVRQIIDASPKSQTRPRLRGGESSKAYRQYMDFTQQYASPEDRAATYNATLEQYPIDTRNQIAGELRRIEADYTSGDTALQREAVDRDWETSIYCR